MFGGYVMYLRDGRTVNLSHLTADQALRKVLTLGVTPARVHYTMTVLSAEAFETTLEFERETWMCDPTRPPRTN